MNSSSSRLFFLFFFFLIHLAFVRGQTSPSAAYLYQNSVSGFAATYEEVSWSPGLGCGYLSDLPVGYQVLMSVSASDKSFGQGELCGICFQVDGSDVFDANQSELPASPYTVLLTNQHKLVSNELGQGFKDLNSEPMQVQYKAVPCPVGETPVQWQVNVDSSAWYIQLMPVYNTIAIAQMCIKSGDRWLPMSRMIGKGLWAYYGTQLTGQPQVKAITVDGQVLVDTIDVDLSKPVTEGMYSGTSPSQFGPLGSLNGPVLDCNADVRINPAQSKDTDKNDGSSDQSSSSQDEDNNNNDQSTNDQSTNDQNAGDNTSQEDQNTDSSSQVNHDEGSQSHRGSPWSFSPALIVGFASLAIASVMVASAVIYTMKKRRNAREAYEAMLAEENALEVDEYEF